MNKVIEKLKQIGVIPLAVFKDEKQAVPVANALSKARIDTLEVTLRTEKGVKAIEEIKGYPKFLVEFLRFISQPIRCLVAIFG